METFKRIDYRVSIILMAAAVVYGLIVQDSRFMAGYFVVGGWQLLSMIIHIYSNSFTYRGTGRSIYNNIIICILVMLLIGVMVPLLLYCVMIFLALASPFMALYYTRLCYKEVHLYMQRPLAQLK